MTDPFKMMQQARGYSKAQIEAGKKAFERQVREPIDSRVHSLVSSLPGNDKEKAHAASAINGLLHGEMDVADLQYLGTDLGKKALHKYGATYGNQALQQLLKAAPVHVPDNIPMGEAVWAVGYQVLSGHFDPNALAHAALQQGKKYVLAEGKRIAVEEGAKLAGSFAANAAPVIGPAVQVFTSGNPFKGASPKSVIACYIVTWSDVLGSTEALRLGFWGLDYGGRQTTNGGIPDPRFHIIGDSIGFTEKNGAWKKEEQAVANYLKANCKDNPYVGVANESLSLIAAGAAGGPIGLYFTALFGSVEAFSKFLSKESGKFKRAVEAGKKKAIETTRKYLKDSGEWRRIITAREETIKTTALAANLMNPVRFVFKGKFVNGKKLQGKTIGSLLDSFTPKPGVFVSSSSPVLYGVPVDVEYFIDGKWKKVCGPLNAHTATSWTACGPSPLPIDNALDLFKKAGALDQSIVEYPDAAKKIRDSVLANVIATVHAAKKQQDAAAKAQVTKIEKGQAAQAKAEAQRAAVAAPAADRAAAAKFAGKRFTPQERDALLKKTKSDLSVAYFQCSDKPSCPEADRLLAEIRWLEGKKTTPTTPPIKRQDQKIAQLKKEIEELKKKAAVAKAARVVAQQAIRQKDTQRQQAVTSGLSPAQAAAVTAPLQTQTAAAVNQATQAAAALTAQSAQVQKAAQAAQVPMAAVQQVIARTPIPAPQRPLAPFFQRFFTPAPFSAQTAAEPAKPAVPTDRPDLFLPFLRK